MVPFTQTEEGVTDALTSPKLVQKSGCFVPATNAPEIHLLSAVHIGGTRPDVRETRAAFFGPGSVFRLFLCLDPLNRRGVSMIRFLLSSRALRLRYHLLSTVSIILARSLAVTSLAAAVFASALCFVEVL